MSTLSIRVPDSLHKRARALAKEEHTSINQLMTTALAEKIAALDAEKMIIERGARGDRSKFLSALNSAPDVEPPEFDRLPDEGGRWP